MADLTTTDPDGGEPQADPAPAAAPAEGSAGDLKGERRRFSDRLANFGLGESPKRLLEDAPRRTSGPHRGPGAS